MMQFDNDDPIQIGSVFDYAKITYSLELKQEATKDTVITFYNNAEKNQCKEFKLFIKRITRK